MEFRERIQTQLRQTPGGLTWRELKESADLPYERPCPEWAKQLQSDIRLDRSQRKGRAQIWRLGEA
ncbi:hypothetical protein [Cerasicoccus fimbriatus]|uniref:hypothetical protein n=1 Tax=Cerasicoccus fimbriatus TaxID=3014554 RepID=UPI0022B344BE|nr:hypothetical protein [Cerasicoccus sp. TK19100]